MGLYLRQKRRIGPP